MYAELFDFSLKVTHDLICNFEWRNHMLSNKVWFSDQVKKGKTLIKVVTFICNFLEKIVGLSSGCIMIALFTLIGDLNHTIIIGKHTEMKEQN